MNNEKLQYCKTYSVDILDQAGDGDNILVCLMAAELVYFKVPAGVTVIMVYPYDWNYHMTPWKYEEPEGLKSSVRSFKKDKNMEHTGGGETFAAGFVKDILEPIEARLSHRYSRRYIAGYSLGGLMAAYMATTLSVFDGFASISGSFWYPGALEFFNSHPYSVRIAKAYYSLGDKEALTMHPLRCEVETKTRELLSATRLQGIEQTTLEMNPGGHFENIPGRIEKALHYLKESCLHNQVSLSSARPR